MKPNQNTLQWESFQLPIFSMFISMISKKKQSTKKMKEGFFCCLNTKQWYTRNALVFCFVMKSLWNHYFFCCCLGWFSYLIKGEGFLCGITPGILRTIQQYPWMQRKADSLSVSLSPFYINVLWIAAKNEPMGINLAWKCAVYRIAAKKAVH